jgi:hypothetical protein
VQASCVLIADCSSLLNSVCIGLLIVRRLLGCAMWWVRRQVRHMERDEPDVAYEVAWVDNASGPNATSLAAAWSFAGSNSSSGLEHVVVSGENMGLAWGLNRLFGDLCTAPFVLILEEDWMYMDGAVAAQTEGRTGAVARALHVAASGATSFDGRKVKCVAIAASCFLRFPCSPLRTLTPKAISFALFFCVRSPSRCMGRFCGQKHTIPSCGRPSRAHGRQHTPHRAASQPGSSTAPTVLT